MTPERAHYAAMDLFVLASRIPGVSWWFRRKVRQQNEGQEVEVAITMIDKRTRKVNLSMKAKDSVEEKAAMDDYNSQSTQASGSTLGDLLKEAKDK